MEVFSEVLSLGFKALEKDKSERAKNGPRKKR